jgi:hypothetical protein
MGKGRSRLKETRAEWEPGPFWGLTVIFLLALLVLGVMGRRELKGQFMDDASFLTTPGTVLMSFTLPCGKNNDSTCFEISYEYRVDSVRYRSEHVSFSSHMGSDRSFAENYMRKYPVGKPVMVYYEKGNPSFAVLEPQHKSNIVKVLLVFLLLAEVSAVAAIYLTLKRQGTTQEVDG